MASWVAEMKARDAPIMAEFNKKIEESVRLKAVKATEELLAEYQALSQKHQAKASIRKMEAEATLLYWKKQAELSVIKIAEASKILASLDNPAFTREISRLEKKLKSLGVKIPDSREAVAVDPLGAKTPLPQTARSPPLTAESLPNPKKAELLPPEHPLPLFGAAEPLPKPKKQIRQIPIRPVYENEEPEESTSYAPIILTEDEIVRELMAPFRC
jgi:hypothetical protein